MNVEMAPAIKAAESEYLFSHVQSLSWIRGNPFGARVFPTKLFHAFK